MSGNRHPQVEAFENVVRFPPRSRQTRPADQANADEARFLLRRQRLVTAWVGGTWVVLAWVVAVCRLRLAISRHEVFGFEATLAGLVATLMPLMEAPRIAAAFRGAATALRRAKEPRQNSKHEETAEPRRPPRRRAGGPL